MMAKVLFEVSNAMRPAVGRSMAVRLNDAGETVPLLPLLRKDVASNGPAWLPLALVLGAMAAVAYADHRVVLNFASLPLHTPSWRGRDVFAQENQLWPHRGLHLVPLL